MSIVIIGGLDRLKRSYLNVVDEKGFKGKVYTQGAPGLTDRIENLDGIVIFTGTVAHKIVHAVVKRAKTRNIPLFRSHSSSISGLKRCLKEMKARG